MSNCVQGVPCGFLVRIGAAGRSLELAYSSESGWYGVYTLHLTTWGSFSCLLQFYSIKISSMVADKEGQLRKVGSHTTVPLLISRQNTRKRQLIDGSETRRIFIILLGWLTVA